MRNIIKYERKMYNPNQMLKFTLSAIKENILLYLNSNLRSSNKLQIDAIMNMNDHISNLLES